MKCPFILIVLLILLCILLFISPTTASTDLHIYEGDDFKSIIENASDNSTIYWHAGTYSSSLPSNRIQIPYCVHIIGDDAEVVILQNITFHNEKSMYTTTGSVIEDLMFTGPYGGIDLSYIQNCTRVANLTIKKCVFSDASTAYIGDGSTIENSTFTDTLLIEGSSDSHGGTVKNCVFEKRGFLYLNCEVQDLLIENNTFQDIISDETGILGVSSSSNIKIRNNVFNNLTVPSLLSCWNSNYVIIKQNVFKNCIVTSPSLATIYFEESEATVYLNDFVNCSTVTVKKDKSNVNWNTPYEISYTYMNKTYYGMVGNYFDNYSGEDIDDDGIGDTPFIVSNEGSKTDYAPLIMEFANYKIKGDWNPWNNEDSENSNRITTDELKEAIRCWVNGILAPYTDAEITIGRLQALVHYWINDLEMSEWVE